MTLPEVEEFFAGLRGRKCWSVIAGAGTGSAILLHIGEKLELRHPLQNPTLSRDEKVCEGERVLFVQCDWRLEAEGRIVCTSQSVTADGVLEFRQFDRIRNMTIVDAMFSSQLHDLKVEFEGGTALTIFCDLPVGEEANYMMFNPTTVVSVTGLGFLTVETRDGVNNIGR